MNITESSLTRQLFDEAEVRRTLGQLLPPGQVTEVRLLKASVGSDRRTMTYSGFFDSHDAVVESLQYVSQAAGIYAVLNPIDPALLARCANRLKPAGDGDLTGDGNIVCRRWLYIDIDPVRPAGISATHDEHEAALERGELVELFLHDLGFPDPIRADSGNGCHLLYPVDLPTDDGGTTQRCLATLGAKFSDGTATIDQTTFNPSRICRLYGTLACKGDSIPSRPHRFSKMLEVAG